MNRKLLFNDGWAFAKSDLDAKDSDGLTFEPVDVPHDWLIDDTLNLYEDGIGWYRKRFFWTREPEVEQVLLSFEGVYMDSSVYVNGRLVGEWKYGYSSFEHDITAALVPGENEIVVKVVYRSPNSRWYSGAGIYRDVWLKTRGLSHLATDGLYITPVQEEGGVWRVEIDAELRLREDVVVSHALMLNGETVAAVSAQAFAAEAGAGGDRTQGRTMNRTMNRTLSQTLRVRDPLLWSPEEPRLYRLVTELRSAAEPSRVFERVSHAVGFRTVVLDPDRGLLLNGVRTKLNGVCEHHDLGALGAAFNAAALRRRFALLKEMGVNAVRTAHNMPAPAWMDLADEMGLLVVSEAFDMWERAKTPYDYARFFREWMPADVKSWVRRDRNHPSLLLWSIGNEIYDTHADERGQAVTRMLMEEVRKHDPKGHAAVTIGSNYMPWANARACADIVKVAGYNYADKYYRAHHEEHPDWVIYGSETASVVQSRGVYHFPFERSILTDDDEQCSALGNSPTSWGAKSAEACLVAERDTPFSLGQFIWTGFDYIGEPTPYHTKNAYFGQLDTATFKKDSFYVYQAAWTDYRTRPMVHLFPYWDFNDGQLIDVRVCTNAPRVELRLNGVTVGAQTFDRKRGTQLVGWWKLPYEAGTLEAIACDEDGAVLATAVRRSFGEAKRLRLQADKERLAANGADLLFVEITAEDADGRPVENANNRVRVEVTGAGRLVGLDNGDSTDYDAYKGVSRRLFSGKLMAIVAATPEPGTVEIRATSAGLASADASFEAVSAAVGTGEAAGADEAIGGADGAGETIGGAGEAGEAIGGADGAGEAIGGVDEAGETIGGASAPAGISARTSNRERPVVTGSDEEIPVRKIAIVSPDGQMFDAARRSMAVHAVLHPANASYREVTWSVVGDGGIPSNLATVEANGLEAQVTALGDGAFRLRCMSSNGTGSTKLISELEYAVSGLGRAFKDPYGFVSAGLYDYSKGEVGSGNERGVATSRDGETQIGFRDLDFGPYGSDTITIPVFALTGDTYAIQIWAGMPDEADSELLADVVYRKPTKWNVYQEETYRLSRHLRGIASLTFVLRQKVHIKGFSFERQSRACALNHAADCDRVYGDAYAIAGTRVEGIGNNVSLEFDGMDFGAEGATKLVVCGRSAIDRNTIHVQFAGADGESLQLLEFAGSDGYEERAFELEKVTGLRRVTFVFLPGSRFDFGWFRFGR